MIYLESIVNSISQQHGRNAQEAMSMNSRILSDSGRERSWQHNVRWSPWSPEAKPPSRKAFRIVQVSNVFKHSGKLSYFTNLNSSAIWGWFPKNKPWFPVGENSEVVIKFTQINGFQASTQFPKKIETSWILLFTAVNFGCSSDVYLKRHMFKKVIQFNIFPTQNHKTSCFAWTLKHVDKLRESRLWYSRQFPVQKKIQCNISP